MDNDDAIVGTILSRRQVFGMAAKTGFGLAFGGLLLTDSEAAFQEQAKKEVKLVASPAMTEGPFFVDEKLNRKDITEGTTRKAVIEALPLTLAIKVYKLTDGKFAPFPAAMVDIWHCDSIGVYSDENHPMNHENTAGQKWLRGYQMTDKNGLASFKTIYPGWYPGRTTHIHFKVRHTSGGTTKEFTSQLFFNDTEADKVFAKAPYKARGTRDARNTSDGIFMERQVSGTKAGDHLMLDTKAMKDGKGYEASFVVALTDDNLRSGGGRRGGGFSSFGS